MNIGISTATLHMRLYNEDALALFGEWGVGTAEVFLTSFCEYEPAFAKTLAEKNDSVKIHSVHVLGTQFEPQLYSAHPRVRGDAEFWLDKAMQSAKILGAENYTFHGVARLKKTFRENLKQVSEDTARIYKRCQKYGVRLCYENVEWAFFNRPDIFRSLKVACPSLGAVLDLKQARLSGYPYEEFLNEMGENLTHVHVSDFDGTKMCLPGRGNFDFKTLFCRLKDAGFHGAVLIENYSRDFGDLGQLKAAYEYLSELAEK